jgi:hypothetical protein
VSTDGLRRSFTALLVLSLALFVAGCGQMSNPTYDLGQAGCAPASDATIAAIQQEVTADGSLRNGVSVRSGAGTLVSAELHLHGTSKHDKGDILTWVTHDAGETQFQSVDINARNDSAWADAPITVLAPGARESRACAASNTGKTKAQIQCELEQNEHQIPADRKCNEL